MTLVEIFVRADRAMTGAIARAADAPSSVRIGPVFATEPADGVPLRAAVAHIARDEAWIPAQLAGRTMADVGPEAFDGDLLGDDAASAFARLAALAQDAAGTVTDLGATVHCSFGDCSSEEYLWQLVVARTLGAEALAVVGGGLVRGGRSAVDDDLAAAVVTGLAPRADLWRQVGILRPALVATGPSPRDELLALAGWAGAAPRPT
jgi:hypothetical protein